MTDAKVAGRDDESKNTKPKPPKLRHVWCDLILSEHGPADPFEQLLLLGLDRFFRDNETCFPSVEKVLGNVHIGRTKCFDLLRDSRWLTRAEAAPHKGRKRYRKTNVYRRAFPGEVAGLVPLAFKHLVGENSPPGGLVEESAPRTSTVRHTDSTSPPGGLDQSARRTQSSSSETPQGSSQRSRSADAVLPSVRDEKNADEKTTGVMDEENAEAFAEVWEAWPENRRSDRDAAESAWFARLAARGWATDELRERCLSYRQSITQDRFVLGLAKALDPADKRLDADFDSPSGGGTVPFSSTAHAKKLALARRHSHPIPQASPDAVRPIPRPSPLPDAPVPAPFHPAIEPDNRKSGYAYPGHAAPGPAARPAVDVCSVDFALAVWPEEALDAARELARDGGLVPSDVVTTLLRTELPSALRRPEELTTGRVRALWAYEQLSAAERRFARAAGLRRSAAAGTGEPLEDFVLAEAVTRRRPEAKQEIVTA